MIAPIDYLFLGSSSVLLILLGGAAQGVMTFMASPTAYQQQPRIANTDVITSIGICVALCVIIWSLAEPLGVTDPLGVFFWASFAPLFVNLILSLAIVSAREP